MRRYTNNNNTLLSLALFLSPLVIPSLHYYCRHRRVGVGVGVGVPEIVFRATFLGWIENNQGAHLNHRNKGVEYQNELLSILMLFLISGFLDAIIAIQSQSIQGACFSMDPTNCYQEQAPILRCGV